MAASSIVYLVDCNDVLADFRKGVLDEFRKRYPGKLYGSAEKRKSLLLEDDFPEESRPLLEGILLSKGLHRKLGVILGSIKGINYLTKKGDVFICIDNMDGNEYFMQEMYDWIEEKLGKVWASKRTIMSPDKTMVYGDFLIDDKPQKGKLEPDWEQLLFDQPYNKSVKGLRRITWRNYKEVLGLK